MEKKNEGKSLNIHKNLQYCFLIALLTLLFVLPASAKATVLGTSEDFAVLGASGVTVAGAENSTFIFGDIGVFPGTSITGLGNVVHTGDVHQTDAVAQQAQADALTAFNFLALLPVTQNLTDSDLGTVSPLGPGVYKFDSSAGLTGTLTLDCSIDPTAEPLFVFQIGTELTTATGSTVVVQNCGDNTGVYWQVGSSATLGTNTLFAGNIIADQSVTLNSESDILCGRAIALNGAVTLDTNTISIDCDAEDFESGRDDFLSFGFSGDGGITTTTIEGPSGNPIPGSSGNTGSENFQMVCYWDLRDRGSFFQVTNTSNQNIRIHIQLFDVDNNCFEFDYFDTLTPFDTHVYNVSELDRNNGQALASPDLSNDHGIIAVTNVNADNTIKIDPVLTGNCRIIDINSYEYRTNFAGAGFGPGAEIGDQIVNFNNVNETSHSDLVFMSWFTRSDIGGIIPTTEVYNVGLFDDQENPISCPTALLGCPAGEINVGVNQAITNSRGGLSLCAGTDQIGFVELQMILPGELPPPGTLGGKNLVIFTGLNNDNGTGSMGTSISTNESEE